MPPKFLQTSETRAQFKLANLQVSQTGFNSQRHMRAEYRYQQKEKTSTDGCSRKCSIFDHKIQDSPSFNLTDISNHRISAVCQCSPEEKKKEPRWVVLTLIDILGSFDSYGYFG